MNTRNVEVSPFFLFLTTLFVACLLISNIIAGKLIQVGGVILTAAVILFPVTYIIGDVLTEVYGYQRARLAIWTGFTANLLMVVCFTFTIILPYPEFWKNQSAYQVVLNNVPRIVFASLIAYLAGEFANSVVLSKMKLITGGRWLWTRTIGSTIVGEGIDTLIFISVGFFGTMPFVNLLAMIIAQYIFKVVYEVVATPFTYLVVGWLKRKEGIDTFDNGVSYNPFRLEVKTQSETNI